MTSPTREHDCACGLRKNLPTMSTATLNSPGVPAVEPVAQVQSPKVLTVSETSAATGPQLWRCDVATYERMIGEGLLDGFRGELIDGYITTEMPAGDKHAYIVEMATDLLKARPAGAYAVASQYPVVLDEVSRPEPDVWVARGPKSRYREAVPRAEDLLLVIEVADSALATDRTVKLGLYARAAVPEYWILNVAERQLERHTSPQADGTYAERRVYGFGESVGSREESLKGEVYGEVTVAALFE